MSIKIRHGVTYTNNPLEQPLVAGDGDSLANDIVLSDGTNELVLSLTANQYTNLLSAALNGAVRSFPENYIEVVYPLIKAGKLAFCDEVDNCIENNPATQTALNIAIENNTILQQTINQIVLSNGNVNPDTSDPTTPEIPTRFPQAERENDVQVPPAACDKDLLWAGILETCNRIDQLARDYYETVVANVDKVERITAIVDLVPLFGDTIADGIQVFADIAPDLLNAYNAHSTPTEIEDVACTLFELVCSECRYPTYNEYYDTYAALGIAGIQDITGYGVQAALDYILGTNGLANEVVWWTSQSIALYIMYMGGTFMGLRGTKWLGIWANIGEGTPTDAWEQLCNGCVTFCYDWDFELSVDDWTIIEGTYPYTEQGTTGVGGANVGGNKKRVNMSLVVNRDVENLLVKIYGVGSPSSGVAELYNDEVLVWSGTLGDNDRDIVINDYCGTLRFYGQRDFQWGVNGYRINGSGTNPYGLDNCP